MDQVLNLPWYVKAFLAFGGMSLIWKTIQNSVPSILKWLQPIALKGTDALVAIILASPILRWFVLGNKDNFLKTVNALLDGLEEISNAVQKRLADDLNEAETAPAAAPVAPAVAPDVPAAPPAPAPEPQDPPSTPAGS